MWLSQWQVDSEKEAINAAFAMIEAAAPTDGLEGALAVQTACTHAAEMAVLAKLDGGFGTERRIVALGSTATRLLKPLQCRWKFSGVCVMAVNNMRASSMFT